MESTVLRVLIADDEPIARQILYDELSTQPNLEVVGEAETGPQVIEQIVNLRPDLVFLDLEMPGMYGLEVILTVRNANLGPAFVLVTANQLREDEHLDDLVLDYLSKPVSPSRLAQSMELVRKKLDPHTSTPVD